jgi:hypothetical protein
MPKYHCHRKECARICSELGFFMSRRRPPNYEGNGFCSESCLLAYVQDELSQKWRRLHVEKNRKIPRPKLGTILLQTSYITRDQLEEAVRLQRQARQGKIGEWLLKLGFVEEHQITSALARQHGLPLIKLENAERNDEAARMIPGKLARTLGIIPVGLDDSQSSIRVAASGPVDFDSQESIRRMVRKGIISYLGDRSAIERLLGEYYEPEDLDLTNVPTFGSVEELVRVGRDVVMTAINQRAQNIQAELFRHLFWMRLDLQSEFHHYFFRVTSTQAYGKEPVPEGIEPLRYAVGS